MASVRSNLETVWKVPLDMDLKTDSVVEKQVLQKSLGATHRGVHTFNECHLVCDGVKKLPLEDLFCGSLNPKRISRWQEGCDKPIWQLTGSVVDSVHFRQRQVGIGAEVGSVGGLTWILEQTSSEVVVPECNELKTELSVRLGWNELHWCRVVGDAVLTKRSLPICVSSVNSRLMKNCETDRNLSIGRKSEGVSMKKSCQRSRLHKSKADEVCRRRQISDGDSVSWFATCSIGFEKLVPESSRVAKTKTSSLSGSLGANSKWRSSGSRVWASSEDDPAIYIWTHERTTPEPEEEFELKTKFPRVGQG